MADKEAKKLDKEKKLAEKKEAKEKKRKQEEKFASITPLVVAAGYCKRTPPTLKQIKNFLKCAKGYKNHELSHLNDSNIVSEFRKLVRARLKK